MNWEDVDKWITFIKGRPVMAIGCILLVVIASVIVNPYVCSFFGEKGRQHAESLSVHKGEPLLNAPLRRDVSDMRKVVPLAKRTITSEGPEASTVRPVVKTIAASVRTIENDFYVVRAVLEGIEDIEGTLSVEEILFIMKAAKISNDFYYAQVIKHCAPLLDYPLGESGMDMILAPLTNDLYRVETAQVLAREEGKRRKQ